MIQLFSKLTPEQARRHVIIKDVNRGGVENEVSLSLNLGGCIVPLDVIEPGTTVLKVDKDQINNVIQDLKGAINRGAFDSMFVIMIRQFEELSNPITPYTNSNKYMINLNGLNIQ